MGNILSYLTCVHMMCVPTMYQSQLTMTGGGSLTLALIMTSIVHILLFHNNVFIAWLLVALTMYSYTVMFKFSPYMSSP